MALGARPGLLDPSSYFQGLRGRLYIRWAMGVGFRGTKNTGHCGCPRPPSARSFSAVERVAILAPVWMRWRPGCSSVILIKSRWVGYARSRLRPTP